MNNLKIFFLDLRRLAKEQGNLAMKACGSDPVFDRLAPHAWQLVMGNVWSKKKKWKSIG